MKKCITCLRIKHKDEFYKKKRKRKSGPYVEISGACKECTIARSSIHSDYEKVGSLRLKNRLLTNSLKSNPCLDCGGIFPVVCMDFDHRDPSIKTRGVSAMMHQKTQTILDEIKKCDLICSNCHRIRTAKLLGWKYATH